MQSFSFLKKPEKISMLSRGKEILEHLSRERLLQGFEIPRAFLPSVSQATEQRRKLQNLANIPMVRFSCCLIILVKV